ncbi:hypothetical protein G4B88_012954 [Cannabis sativa]|uniref:Malectin-like domain-containing protein n=1 Tax=Cannabis sativa TaxID=3483 RepID=A0A7J6FKJ3_CANSA|nr:hypothetical protein G4B88_012954 [Cannabis sativa]
MDKKSFWVFFILFSGFWVLALSVIKDGFLSLSCGGTSNYTDSSGVLWIPDSDYISLGNITTIKYNQNSFTTTVSARYFPVFKSRKCYRIPLKNTSSLVLIRAKFVYKNYDGLGKPPSFSVSLGTAIVGTIDLAKNDPQIEEFVWPVSKETLSFCLLGVRQKGAPVISSLEVRPLPQGAYTSGVEDFQHKSLRKNHRINCGYTNGSLRYEPFTFNLLYIRFFNIFRLNDILNSVLIKVIDQTLVLLNDNQFSLFCTILKNTESKLSFIKTDSPVYNFYKTQNLKYLPMFLW